MAGTRHFLTGLEIECEPLAGVDERFLHCFADSEIAPGYIAWVVPGVDATQIGLAAPAASTAPISARLLRRLKTHCDIRDIRVTSRRSGLIPSGGVVKNLGTNRVMLVGDAAGMVSPVTGGGIHTALHFGPARARTGLRASGRIAGRIPCAALAKEAPRYRAKLLLRRLLDLAPPNALINAMLMTGADAKALAQRLYFHARGESALSCEAWTEAFDRGEPEAEKPKLQSDLAAVPSPRPPRGALGRAPVLRTPRRGRGETSATPSTVHLWVRGKRIRQQFGRRADFACQLLELRPGARVGALVAFGKDHFVLLGVFQAGEFGHPHLVAMGFQIQPAQHIGEMGAEFAPLDAVAPELLQRRPCARPAPAPVPPGSRAPAPRIWRHASARTGWLRRWRCRRHAAR